MNKLNYYYLNVTSFFFFTFLAITVRKILTNCTTLLLRLLAVAAAIINVQTLTAVAK